MKLLQNRVLFLLDIFHLSLVFKLLWKAHCLVYHRLSSQNLTWWPTIEHLRIQHRHLSCIFSSSTSLQYLPNFWRIRVPNHLNTMPRLSWQQMVIITSLAWLVRCIRNFQLQHTCSHLVLKTGIDISKLTRCKQVLAGINRIFSGGFRAKFHVQAIFLILISISNLEVFAFVAFIHTLDQSVPHFGFDLPLAYQIELPITTLEFVHSEGRQSNRFFHLLLTHLRLFRSQFAFYLHVTCGYFLFQIHDSLIDKTFFHWNGVLLAILCLYCRHFLYPL